MFDLLNTATVELDLPTGVVYTSQSGVFLTAQDNAVPEPSIAMLMAIGLAGFATRFSQAETAVS